MGRVGKHLGEAANHALSYLPVLSLAERRQVAPAVLRVLQYDVHLLEHLYSCGGKFVDVVGLGHHFVGNLISGTPVDVS